MGRALFPWGRLLVGATGWLYLAAGAALLSAAALVPAQDDLARAQVHRDRARALLDHQRTRIAAYSDRIAALQNPDETLTIALVQRQLNLAPAGTIPLLVSGEAIPFWASPLTEVEPPAPDLPEREPRESPLRTLATGGLTRLLMIAGGAVCVLVGLLPPAKGRSAPSRNLRAPAADPG